MLKKKFLVKHTHWKNQKWRSANFLVTTMDRIKKIRTLTDACLDKASQVQTAVPSPSQPRQCGLVHLCRLRRCVAACVRDIGILVTYTSSNSERKPAAKTRRYAVDRRAARFDYFSQVFLRSSVAKAERLAAFVILESTRHIVPWDWDTIIITRGFRCTRHSFNALQRSTERMQLSRRKEEHFVFKNDITSNIKIYVVI